MPIQIVKLLLEFLLFSVIFFALLNVDAVVRRDLVQLGQPLAQLLQLSQLYVPRLFCLLIFTFECSEFLSQELEPLCGVVDLLHHIGFVLLACDRLQLFLSFELIHFQLSL